MFRIFYFIVCVILSLQAGIQSYGQGENNNWVFGDQAALNFNTSPPGFFQSHMTTVEGCSSISDAAGNLLFYTKGSRIWDRNGNVMPNSVGMLGNGGLTNPDYGSSHEGVSIIKSAANAHQYYVFCTDANEALTHKLYYSVVDMSLNGGMGDVAPTQKNIVLIDSVMECIETAVNGSCSGYWVVAHKYSGLDFLAFQIDANGVNPSPVVSKGMVTVSLTPLQFGNSDGWASIKLSHNGSLLVKTCNGTGNMEFATFNNITGTLSNFFLLDVAPQNSGLYTAFSPDDSKLYFSASGIGVYQLNLSLLPNIFSVQSSKTLISSAGPPASPVDFMGMRLSPDNKIYVLRQGLLKQINTIDNPNNLGLSCNFNDAPQIAGLSNPINFCTTFGSPARVLLPKDTTILPTLDTHLCFQPSATLSLPGVYHSWLWSTGSSNATETVTQDGTYWAYGYEGCHLYIDSFSVRFTNFTIPLPNDTGICNGDNIILDATVANAATYLWNNGSTSPLLPVNQEGRYSVVVTKDGCIGKDSVYVTLMNPYVDILQNDTLICRGAKTILQAKAFPPSTFLWNTGSTDAEIAVARAGTYKVTATNVCGTFGDSVHIEEEYCSCNAFVPTAFSPNGDGMNDKFEVRMNCKNMSAYQILIFNRYGQKVFASGDLNDSWDGTFRGASVDVGTYFYYLNYLDNDKKLVERKGDVTLLR